MVFILNLRILNGIGEHLLIVIKISLSCCNIAVINEFLNNKYRNTTINQLADKQVPTQMACSLNSKLIINTSKQTAYAYSVVGLIQLLRGKEISFRA